MLTAMPKTLMGVIPVLILSASYYVYLKFKESKAPPPEKILYDVMFFTDKGAVCREHIFNKRPCPNSMINEQGTENGCVNFSIRKIVDYIKATKDTLDVCIYLLTYHDVANAILSVHNKGKTVRLIADADMSQGSGSQIEMLKKCGVPVRMKKSPFLMHHKYFIVDKKLLLTGSFNWTMQAVAGNWDNVIVTSQPTLVQKFYVQFNDLWREFA